MKTLMACALSLALALTSVGLQPSAVAAEQSPSEASRMESLATPILVAQLKSTPRTKPATCISGDGKKVCDCGTLDCKAGATSCDCIKAPAPPPPDPSRSGAKFKQ
jgi:hypothetical protein